jgi:uncharacterized phage protein gp47/JayE
MSFQRPTLQEQIDRAMSDIESRLPGAQPRLRDTVLGVLARLRAESAHDLHGHLDWNARQILPDTADADSIDRQAEWRAGLTRLAAVAATGSVSFTGTNGAVIPAGTQLQAASGEIYTTDAEATIAAGTATAATTAEVAGAAGNQAAGVALPLLSPIAGVNSQATVAAAGLTGGADAETDERLLSRLRDALRTPAQGGSRANYATWALAAHPDVTNAWVQENAMGAGTVTVRVMTYGATANGIPTQTVLDAVFAYIDARRTAGMKGLYVVAPIADALNFTISGLNPSTQAVRDAIEAELKDLLAREAEPAGTIYLSHIREAISIAADEFNHALTAPAADVVSAAGHISVMGVITWV